MNAWIRREGEAAASEEERKSFAEESEVLMRATCSEVDQGCEPRSGGAEDARAAEWVGAIQGCENRDWKTELILEQESRKIRYIFADAAGRDSIGTLEDRLSAIRFIRAAADHSLHTPEIATILAAYHFVGTYLMAARLELFFFDGCGDTARSKLMSLRMSR